MFIWSIAEANILYLETPVGVGFSYSTDSSAYVAVDDEATGMYLSTQKKKRERKKESKRRRSMHLSVLTGEKKSFSFFLIMPLLKHVQFRFSCIDSFF